MGMTLGIDASRNRSGGAIAHLVGIISNLVPSEHGIEHVHIWSYRLLLDQLPERNWLTKHNPIELEKSLPHQLFWQAFMLKRDFERLKCDMLFTTDASTLSKVKPSVVLSQDLLSYEPSILKEYGFGVARLRLEILFYVQNAAFRKADGVIFLSEYSSRKIQSSVSGLNHVKIIPHGVHDTFQNYRTVLKDGGETAKARSRIVYVSPIFEYKNHVKVVQACDLLRRKGLDIELYLAGEGSGHAKSKLTKHILDTHESGSWVKMVGNVSHQDIPDFMSSGDVFVFASTCETFGITLLEGMALGLPIASSNLSSLPEVLGEGGLYFDPYDIHSISEQIERLLTDPQLSSKLSMKALDEARKFSWARCSAETFQFISEIYTNLNKA